MNEVAEFNSFEIEMTREQAMDASHSGDCETEVDELLLDPDIAKQLDKIGDEVIKTELKEYGAWDDEELTDVKMNQKRIVWLAAGNIRDEIYEKEKNLTEEKKNMKNMSGEKRQLMEFAKDIRQGKAQKAMDSLKKVVDIKQGKRLRSIMEDEVSKDEQLVRDVMENMPEYSINLDCIGWKYNECRYTFRDTDDKKTYVLELPQLLKGLDLIKDARSKGQFRGLFPFNASDEDFYDAGTWDAEAGDVLVQMAIFGKVIYG